MRTLVLVVLSRQADGRRWCRDKTLALAWTRLGVFSSASTCIYTGSIRRGARTSPSGWWPLASFADARQRSVGLRGALTLRESPLLMLQTTTSPPASMLLASMSRCMHALSQRDGKCAYRLLGLSTGRAIRVVLKLLLQYTTTTECYSRLPTLLGGGIQ